MKMTVKEFIKLDLTSLMQVNGGTSACGNYTQTQPATPPSGGNETNNSPSNNGGGTGGSGNNTTSYSPSYSGGSTTGTSTGTCGGSGGQNKNPGGDNPSNDKPNNDTTNNNNNNNGGGSTSVGGCSSINGGNGNGDELKGKEEDEISEPGPYIIDENSNKLTQEDISSTPDKVDYSKTSWVKEGMDSAGYDFLSDDNSNGYVAGSERNYYQSEFINAINNPELKVTRYTRTIEGSVGAGFGHENYYEYSIVHKETGSLIFQFADINGDGKVDYVKR